MSSEHKRAHKAPLLFSRKFLDEAITGEEIGYGPRCKATARGGVEVGVGGGVWVEKRREGGGV